MGRDKSRLPDQDYDERELDLVKKLYDQYWKYARPDAETRAVLDKEMGDKTLTEELYDMREGS